MYQETPSLYEAYSKYFKVGAAIMPPDLITHRSIIKRHFNSITPGNALKFGPIHPDEPFYEFGDADQLVAFAQEHGKSIRAHAPVWHTQTGDWLFNRGEYFADRDLVLERLEDHIRVLATRYRNCFYAWDVVNEGIVDGAEGYMRETKWFKSIGPDYMDHAFRFVRKYSPETQLFYNDYNEFNPAKRERILRLVRGFQERNIPIDGIGMQQHVSIYTDLDEIKRSIEAYAATGLILHITELDVSLYQSKPRNPYQPAPLEFPTREDFQRQHQRYIDLFEIYRSYSDVIESVTTWGVADDATWLDVHPVPGRKNYPLLFSYDHSPKPCTLEIIQAAL